LSVVLCLLAKQQLTSNFSKQKMISLYNVVLNLLIIFQKYLIEKYYFEGDLPRANPAWKTA